MLIAIDISEYELTNCCVHQPTNPFTIHLDYADMELFWKSMLLSKPKSNYGAEAKDILDILMNKYGFENVQIPSHLFDGEFRVQLWKTLQKGVDVQFSWEVDTTDVPNVYVVLHMRVLGHDTQLRVCCYNQSDVDHSEYEYPLIRFDDGEWMEPNPAVDDDVCWWTYWTGVPRLQRAFVIAAIRKLMTLKENREFINTLWLGKFNQFEYL